MTTPGNGSRNGRLETLLWPDELFNRLLKWHWSRRILMTLMVDGSALPSQGVHKSAISDLCQSR